MVDRLAIIDMNRKVGGCCAPFWGGELAGSPSNTMWPGPKATSTPGGILIHPAVQPFGHNGHGPKIGGCAPFGEGSSIPI